MAAVLLDTTVLIDALRGRGAVARMRALRAAGDVPHVCAVNVEELVRGVRDREWERTRRFLSALEVVPLGLLEGSRAGAWRRSFALRGRTLHQADCLVAAAALRVGGRLATGNPKDFPMEEIVVEHWPVGA